MLVNQMKKILKSREGALKDLTWVIGAAVVTALIIVGAMVYAPDTAETFWNDAADWIRSEFGF